MDGDCYEGKEDHVWMDIGPFKNIKWEIAYPLGARYIVI